MSTERTGTPPSELDIDQLDAPLIATFLEHLERERGNRAATRNNRLNQLSGLFSYAYGRRWIDHHPTEKGRGPKLPVDNERDRWLRPEEIVRLARAARTLKPLRRDRKRDRWRRPLGWLVPILRFAPFVGLRLGNICGLRKHDVQYDDQDRAYLVITASEMKNKRPRSSCSRGPSVVSWSVKLPGVASRPTSLITATA